MNREEILTILKAHLGDLKRRFGVRRIGLFGSYARNENTENSDIDLIVDLEKKDFFVRAELTECLQNMFKRKIDLGYLESMRAIIRREAEKDIIYA